MGIQENIAANVSANIREWRKIRKMTQAELAEAIGKTASTVQKYELGAAMPPLDVLSKIAYILLLKYLFLSTLVTLVF